MIATTVVEEIRRMLTERRLSQRKIAAVVGVSRGTVNAIARGRRLSCPPRRGPAAEGFQPPSGPHLRCPGCGGKVQMPCLACYVRTVARNASPLR